MTQQTQIYTTRTMQNHNKWVYAIIFSVLTVLWPPTSVRAQAPVPDPSSLKRLLDCSSKCGAGALCTLYIATSGTYQTDVEVDVETSIGSPSGYNCTTSTGNFANDVLCAYNSIQEDTAAPSYVFDWQESGLTGLNATNSSEIVFQSGSFPAECANALACTSVDAHSPSPAANCTALTLPIKAFQTAVQPAGTIIWLTGPQDPVYTIESLIPAQTFAFRWVALHELAHTYGLGHLDLATQSQSTDRLDTMQDPYPGGGWYHYNYNNGSINGMFRLGPDSLKNFADLYGSHTSFDLAATPLLWDAVGETSYFPNRDRLTCPGDVFFVSIARQNRSSTGENARIRIFVSNNNLITSFDHEAANFTESLNKYRTKQTTVMGTTPMTLSYNTDYWYGYVINPNPLDGVDDYYQDDQIRFSNAPNFITKPSSMCP